MGIPFWLDNPDAWDCPIVAGITLPGLSKLEGTGLAKLDKKTAPGSSGATMTYLGDDPIEVEITTTIWEAEHLKVYEQLVAKITPKAGKKKREPVSISHPKLTPYGVDKLFVSQIGLLKDSARVKGGMDFTIKFVQFFPPVGGVAGTFGKKGSTDLARLDGSGRVQQAPDVVQATLEAVTQTSNAAFAPSKTDAAP